MITQHGQTKGALCGSFGLFVLSGLQNSPHGLVSPYYTNRNLHLTNQIMSVIKFFWEENLPQSNGQMFTTGTFVDTSTNTFLSTFFPFVDLTTFDNKSDYLNSVISQIVTQAATNGYTGFSASDIVDIVGSPVLATVATSGSYT